MTNKQLCLGTVDSHPWMQVRYAGIIQREKITVKLKALVLALLIPLIFSAQTAVAASSSSAIQQMADVLLKLQIAPDAPQRQTLKQIASGTNVTRNEQNLAKAMLNMKGSIQPEDKQLVWGVLRDINAGEDEKELAKLINRFNDKADKTDKARLNKLLPPKPKKNINQNKKKAEEPEN